MEEIWILGKSKDNWKKYGFYEEREDHRMKYRY